MNRREFIAGSIALAATPCYAQSDPMPIVQPRCYRTQQIVHDSLPVTSGSDTHWGTIHVLPIGPIVIGDIINATWDTEVQNVSYINTEFVTQVLLSGSNYVDTSVDAVSGQVLIGRIMGFDVDQTTHYFVDRGATIYQSEVIFPDAYLIFRVRCRSTAYLQSNGWNIIKPYGHLAAMVFPKNA